MSSAGSSRQAPPSAWRRNDRLLVEQRALAELATGVAKHGNLILGGDEGRENPKAEGVRDLHREAQQHWSDRRAEQPRIESDMVERQVRPAVGCAGAGTETVHT